MIFNTNKERGNAGLSLAIAYYGANGYVVSIPLNDTQDYDLIVEKNEVLQKIQVKATGYKKDNGIYQVNLKSAGGTKGKIYKKVIETNVDILFIVTSNKDLYEIPLYDIKNTSSINLYEKYKKYKVYI